MTHTRRLLTGLFALLMTATLGIVPAQASTSPSFTSNWSATKFVEGSTTFTVHTSAKATIKVVHDKPSYINPAYVTIEIQRQTCGSFGCSWKDQDDAWVGGSCTVAAGATKTCTFTPPISNRLHRVVISKSEYNEFRHSGSVAVS